MPPYFADFNPLELVFGKVKAFLKERIASFFPVCDTPKPLLAFGFGMIDCTVCACLCMDSTMLWLYNYTHKWNECMNKEYWVRVHR